MADGVFNIAKGRAAYYSTLPATNDALIIVLLKDTVDADEDLVDYDDLAALLAANDECDFTNYTRKTITSVTVTVEDTLDAVFADFADQLYVSAGGATNNNITKALVCYDPDTTGGTDSSIIPLTHHDFVFVTTGADLPLSLHPSGFYGAG